MKNYIVKNYILKYRKNIRRIFFMPSNSVIIQVTYMFHKYKAYTSIIIIMEKQKIHDILLLNFVSYVLKYQLKKDQSIISYAIQGYYDPNIYTKLYDLKNKKNLKFVLLKFKKRKYYSSF